MALQNSDNFIVGRGTTSHKITYEYLKDSLNIPPPLTLQVGKGSISPSSGVEVGDSVTGLATVTGSLNPVEVNVFSVDGVEVQRGSSNSYTTTATGSLTYHKEVTDDNNVSPVIGAESDAVTVTSSAEPSATMSGLRFDSNRQTYLGRSSTNISSTFTFSCWHKPSGASGSNTILNVNDKDIAIEAQNTGVYSVDVRGINFTSSSGVATKNAWQNLVVSYDGNILTVYVNGVEIGTTTGAQTIRDGVINLGSYQGTTNFFNGYLSDVYFVENQVLEPTAFGKLFEGDKWGPLNSTKVKENITNVVPPEDPTQEEIIQPFDYRPNTDEVWSGMLTSPGTIKTPTGGFNGLITDKSEGTGGLTFTPTTSIPYTKSVEVYAAGPIKYNVNGDAWFNNPTGSGSTWMTVASGSGTLDTLNSIRVDNPTFDAGWNAVRIDGRVLVDQGVWNPSNWNAQTTYNGSQIPLDQFEKLFDGVPTNSVQANSNTASSLITWDSGVIGGTVGDVIRIFFQGNITTIAINGTARTITQYDWFTVPENYLTSLEVKHPSGGNICNPGAIEVNGEILVDGGAQWNTSEFWSDKASYTGAMFSGDYPSNMFDGNLNSYSHPNTNTIVLTTFDSLPTGTFELYVKRGGGSSPLKVNGISIADLDSPPDTWYTVTGNTLSSIEVSHNGSANLGIGAIRLNGELLINGNPEWNISQVWSDNTTADNIGQTFNGVDNIPSYITNIFDGDTTIGLYPVANTVSTIDLTSLTIPSGTFEVYIGYNGNQSATGVTFNGDQTIAGLGPAGWYTLPVTPDTIEVANTSGNFQYGLHAIKVDGAILVDGAPTWNTSDVWSKRLTATNSSGQAESATQPSAAFDGDLLGAYAYSSSQGALTFNATGLSEFTGTKSYEVFLDTGTGLNVKYTADGGEVDLGTLQRTVSFAATNLTEIKVTGVASGALLSGIKVNGEILVDKGSFGDNGFYLPFDPAATGANYTSSLTSTSDFQVGKGPENAFDGDLTTSAIRGSAGNLRFTIPAGLSGILEVYTSVAGQGIEYDGVVVGSSVSGWNVLGPATEGVFCNITTSCEAFRANGKILLNHNSIGVDASGEGNNFQDQNFALNSTGAIYSGASTSNAPTVMFEDSAGALFNGDTNTGIKWEGTGSSTSNNITLQLTTPITTKDGKIKCIYNGTGTLRTIQFNSEAAQTFIVGSGGTYRTAELVAPASITSITCADAGGQGASARITGLYDISGNLIVDANLQDTVTDTPLKDYAVLDSAVNGNLATTANTQAGTTSSISVTGKVYAEALITLPSEEIRVGLKNDAKADVIMLANRVEFNEGDVVGIAVDVPGASVDWYVSGVFLRTDSIDTSGGIKIGGNSGNTGTNGSIIFNFGQQPFVHTPPAGYVGLYQTWSEYARSTLGYALDRISELERLRLEDATTIETLRVDITTALSRISSIESDEINDDAVDNALLTLVGNLSSQITLWQSRIETAEIALASALERITTLEN